MSEAAEQYVRTCTHPRVKGSARALLTILAQHIPEGQTTTPLIGMPDLAVQARLHRRTVVRWLSDLVEIGELTVIDGGQGRVARYTFVHLAGVPPPMTAPLPLVGATPRRPSSRRPPAEASGNLFEAAASPDSEEPAINMWRSITGGRAERVINDLMLVVNMRRSITGWLLNMWRTITCTAQLVTNDHMLAPPLDVAEYVHTLKEVHTHAASLGEPPKPAAETPRPRAPTHPWHAWCDGRVHVPTNLHTEFLGKMGRLPGESETAQEARLVAFYARRCAEIPDDQPIGSNDYQFWRPAFAAAFPRVAPMRERPVDDMGEPSADERIWQAIVQRLEVKVQRCAFHTWIKPLAFVGITGDVIEVRAPSDDHAAWIQRNHGDVLRDTVEAERPGARVEFIALDERQRKSG